MLFNTCIYLLFFIATLSKKIQNNRLRTSNRKDVDFSWIEYLAKVYKIGFPNDSCVLINHLRKISYPKIRNRGSLAVERSLNDLTSKLLALQNKVDCEFQVISTELKAFSKSMLAANYDGIIDELMQPDGQFEKTQKEMLLSALIVKYELSNAINPCLPIWRASTLMGLEAKIFMLHQITTKNIRQSMFSITTQTDDDEELDIFCKELGFEGKKSADCVWATVALGIPVHEKSIVQLSKDNACTVSEINQIQTCNLGQRDPCLVKDEHEAFNSACKQKLIHHSCPNPTASLPLHRALSAKGQGSESLMMNEKLFWTFIYTQQCQDALKIWSSFVDTLGEDQIFGNASNVKIGEESASIFALDRMFVSLKECQPAKRIIEVDHNFLKSMDESKLKNVHGIERKYYETAFKMLRNYRVLDLSNLIRIPLLKLNDLSGNRRKIKALEAVRFQNVPVQEITQSSSYEKGLISILAGKLIDPESVPEEISIIARICLGRDAICHPNMKQDLQNNWTLAHQQAKKNTFLEIIDQVCDGQRIKIFRFENSSVADNAINSDINDE